MTSRERDLRGQIANFGYPLRRLAEEPNLEVKRANRNQPELTRFFTNFHQHNYVALHSAGKNGRHADHLDP